MSDPLLDVTIPGDPVPQGRPRAHRVGNGIRVYDPPKAKKWKRGAAILIRHAASPIPLVRDHRAPLSVEIDVVIRRPKSAPKTRQLDRQPHVKRPDLDNIVKCVLDAATSAGIWGDDSQVCELVARKWQAAMGEEPSVRLVVRNGV